MSRFTPITLIIFLLSSISAQANPFVDEWISYNPGPGQFVTNPTYNDPSKCKGAPVGGLSVYVPDNSSVVTLGDGGSIVLAFNNPIYDNPKNPYGLDFIVFSNTQFVGTSRWQELAYVEISQDGVNWYLILPSILPADLIGGVDTGTSSTVVSGYAEYTPTLPLPAGGIRTSEEFYTTPDRQSIPGNSSLIAIDAASGGGDAFDITRAVHDETTPGVPDYDSQGKVIPAGISSFQYVRITDAVVGDYIPDLGEISAEIDAVAQVHPAVTLGEAKNAEAGSYVVIQGAVVTARFSGEFFIEAPDRSAAIKAASKLSVKPGDRVTITGHISKTSGIFKLPDPLITITSSSLPLQPVGIPICNLSRDLSYGVLVRSWGKVTDPGDGTYCVLTDGASSVKVKFNSYFTAAAGSNMTLTAICDREEGTGATILRVFDLNSITTY